MRRTICVPVAACHRGIPRGKAVQTTLRWRRTQPAGRRVHLRCGLPSWLMVPLVNRPWAYWPVTMLARILVRVASLMVVQGMAPPFGSCFRCRTTHVNPVIQEGECDQDNRISPGRGSDLSFGKSSNQVGMRSASVSLASMNQAGGSPVARPGLRGSVRVSVNRRGLSQLGRGSDRRDDFAIVQVVL